MKWMGVAFKTQVKACESLYFFIAKKVGEITCHGDWLLAPPCKTQPPTSSFSSFPHLSSLLPSLFFLFLFLFPPFSHHVTSLLPPFSNPFYFTLESVLDIFALGRRQQKGYFQTSHKFFFLISWKYFYFTEDMQDYGKIDQSCLKCQLSLKNV